MRYSRAVPPSDLRSPINATRLIAGPACQIGLSLVLVIYLTVSVGFGLLNPLAEAPDEIAHIELIRFIGRTGHLPWNDDERAEAGYKSDTPMLYHLAVAKLVGWVGLEDRPRLKVNSLSPQRLLVSDGLSPFTLIHTWDEALPYRGIVLGWHLARVMSTLLGLVTLLVVYGTGRVLFAREPAMALLATALVAALPQFLFLSASVNDDALLGLLCALYVSQLAKIWRQPAHRARYALAGLWMGLAVTTKYSAVPLVLLLPLLLMPLRRRDRLTMGQAAGRLLIFVACAVLAAAWWFIFVEWHFNRVSTLGPWAGLIEPLLGGKAADATMRQAATLISGGALSVGVQHPPTLQAWGQWVTEMFDSFWLFPADTGPVAGSLLSLVFAGLTVLAGIAAIRERRRQATDERPNLPSLEPSIVALFGVQIFLLGLLPVFRFWMTRNIAETAQGRHILVPALPAVGYLLSSGWCLLVPVVRRRWFPWILPAGLLLVSLIAFLAFRLPAFPSPLPVNTVAVSLPSSVEPVGRILGSSIELAGISVGKAQSTGTLPVSLVWKCAKPVQQDFRVAVWLSGQGGDTVALWLGQPVDGRYPTRAWEEGDTVFDTVWLPIAAIEPGTYDLHANLCLVSGSDPCPASGTGVTVPNVFLPETPRSQPTTDLTLPGGQTVSAVVWRRDHPVKDIETFTFRSAIPVSLLTAEGATLEGSEAFLVGLDDVPRAPIIRQGNNFTFEVAADWPSGPYRLHLRLASGDTVTSPRLLSVSVRQRRFDLPVMQKTVSANFGDELELAGYDFPIRRIQPGGQLPLRLYWRARKPMQASYVVFNHLLKSDDMHQWGGQDRIPKDFYSTVLWATGEVVVDSYTVQVDARAPAGIYRLDVGVYVDQDGVPISLPLVSAGQVLDSNSVTIGSVKVGGPPPALTASGAAPHTLRGDNLADSVALVGYDLVQEETHLDVTLYWNCLTSLPADLTTFVHLRSAVEPDAPPAAQKDRPPADGAYPTSLWDPGETVRDQVVVTLPGHLPVGDYWLVVGLYNPQTGQRLAVSSTAETPKSTTGGEIWLQPVTIQR